jgi:DNA-binding transcriptional regulator YiaG
MSKRFEEIEMSIAKQGKRLLPEFTMDHLGTSFEVVLVHSVWKEAEDIIIPEEFGLYKVIARYRVLDSRKLTGGDIKYLRKSLGFKAKDLASALDISPEYLSRCEGDEKIMSSQMEKLLRLVVLTELEQAGSTSAKSARRVLRPALIAKWAEDVRHVMKMKIQPVALAGETMTYRLQHNPTPHVSPANVDRVLPLAARDEWEGTQLACAYA